MIPSREIRTVPNADGTECAKRRAIGLEIVGSTRNPLPGSTAPIHPKVRRSCMPMRAQRTTPWPLSIAISRS